MTTDEDIGFAIYHDPSMAADNLTEVRKRERARKPASSTFHAVEGRGQEIRVGLNERRALALIVSFHPA